MGELLLRVTVRVSFGVRVKFDVRVMVRASKLLGSGLLFVPNHLLNLNLTPKLTLTLTFNPNPPN